MVLFAQTEVGAAAAESIVRMVPRLLAFVAILVVGYVLARWLRRLLGAALTRWELTRVLERAGIRGALARADIDAGAALLTLVFYGLMLLVLQAALSVLGPNPLSDVLADLLAFLPRVAVAVIVVVVAAAVGAAVRNVVAALLGSLPYAGALASAAYGLIVGVGVFAALDQLEIAPVIVTGLFYAVLAVVVGVTVVAVGGGGIAPMRHRWERTLSRFDEESQRMREEARRQREAEEQARRQREAEEQARRQREAEEEARRQREAEEEARRQREAEEEARRQREAEEEARRQREVIRSTPPTTEVPAQPTTERSSTDTGETAPFDPDPTETITRAPSSRDEEDEVTEPTTPPRRRRAKRPDGAGDT